MVERDLSAIARVRSGKQEPGLSREVADFETPCSRIGPEGGPSFVDDLIAGLYAPRV